MSAPVMSRGGPGWHGESTVSLSRLWLGLLIAPIVWLGGELLGYYITARACDPTGGIPMQSTSHPATAVLGVEIVAAALAAIGFVIALRSWRATRVAGDVTPPVSVGRAHFMAFAGTITSALFFVGILWFGFPAIVVDACNQAR
ncbi:MAG TPA: hypothetical protein VIP11_05830 [Gemmatimonadaceae bacterium]